MGVEHTISVRSGKDEKETARIETGEKGELKLILPGGVTLEIKERQDKGKIISDKEFAALEVMKLAIPEAFPEETTGTGDAGFQVEYEKNIKFLPGNREESYELALGWAGATLAAYGWDAERVSTLFIKRNPRIKTAKELNNIGSDNVRALQKRLTVAIASYYPGAKAAEKRRKLVEDW